MSTAISLVIADDHEIFRDGLALMLSKQDTVKLVGQAGDGLELVRMVDETRPDMVLTDIKMPRMDGIAAAKQLLQKHPGLKIIALSMFEEEDLIVEMLEAGARLLEAVAVEAAEQLLGAVHRQIPTECQA